MFKVNIEELKKELQEKLLKLKKVDEKLKKLVSEPLDLEDKTKPHEIMKKEEFLSYSGNEDRSSLFKNDDYDDYDDYYYYYNNDDYNNDCIYTSSWDEEEDEEDDIITDPAYSFLPCNIFYEDDHYDSFNDSTDYNTFDDDLSHDPFNDPFDDPFNDW